MNAESLAPVMSTVRYRSESDVTTMRSFSDTVLDELWLVDEVYESGVETVGDYQAHYNGIQGSG